MENFLQFTLVIAFLLSLLLTRMAIPVAHRLRLVDMPGARKLQSRPVAYLGGVAVMLALALALAAGLLLFRPLAVDYRRLLWVLLPALAACALGLGDDLWNLPAKPRFLLQALLVLAFCEFGFRFEIFHLPGLPPLILGWAAVPVTAFFMLAMLNGFNMIDGSDGLAGSVAVIAGFNLAVAACLTANPSLVSIGLACLGAGAGFLMYNRPPARVYLGSAGSYGLGLLLSGGVVALGSAQAGLPVAGHDSQPFIYHVGLAVLLLVWPALEVGLSVTRRALHGRKISRADRGHLHHRLLGLGLGPGQVALLAGGYSLLCGFMVFSVLYQQKGITVVLGLLAALLLGLGLAFLGYLDFLKPGLLRTRRPHFQIANYFLAMQVLKLDTVTRLDQGLALVSQACHELGCLSCRVVLPARREGGRPWVWSWKSAAPGTPRATDRKRLEQRQGNAAWVLRACPGASPELENDSRVLMAEFMDQALPKLRGLYYTAGDVERMLASAMPYDEKRDFLVHIWCLRQQSPVSAQSGKNPLA